MGKGKETGNVGDRHKGKLLVKTVALFSAALIAVSVALTVIGANIVSKTYGSLIMEELKATCEHLDSAVSSMNDGGDWSMEDGALMKGGSPIDAEIEAMIDKLKAETGIDYTIFYGDTRVLTTIYRAGTSQKLIGTKASSAVISETLNGGREYSSDSLNIEGQPYFGFYCPLANSDGRVIGMVFTGRESSDVTHAIARNIGIMAGVAVAFAIAVVAIGITMALKVSRQMHGVAEAIEMIAEGDLGGKVDAAMKERDDELGAIAESTELLGTKLKEVIGETKKAAGELSHAGADLADSSGQASQASGQVTEAVTEVSKGAVAQAESVQDAAAKTDSIGSDIDRISESVGLLDGASQKMQASCDKTTAALTEIVAQNGSVAKAVSEIGETIDATNGSAHSIAKFSDAINDIASQTNLLSLNASIEAARAGEAGKGFAVVADEIRQLADQSKHSADEIKSIVDTLLRDASASVKVMEALNESIRLQGMQIEGAQRDMGEMAENVSVVSGSAKDIAGMVESLGQAKSSLVEIVQDLSAISEENAASTEETNASMEELNATFSVISESASTLQSLAGEMSGTISYFRD